MALPNNTIKMATDIITPDEGGVKEANKRDRYLVSSAFCVNIWILIRESASMPIEAIMAGFADLLICGCFIPVGSAYAKLANLFGRAVRIAADKWRCMTGNSEFWKIALQQLEDLIQCFPARRRSETLVFQGTLYVSGHLEADFVIEGPIFSRVPNQMVQRASATRGGLYLRAVGRSREWSDDLHRCQPAEEDRIRHCVDDSYAVECGR